MAWTMKATVVESCSCAMVCPCTLGPAKPDQGWCSGAFGIQVNSGSSGGVDLSGAKFALQAELQGDFLGGIDKAKLYLDEGLSEAQRKALESIIQGEQGGVWGGMREAIKQWLPSAVTSVDVQTGDAPAVDVKGVGTIRLQPIRTEDGKPATLNNAPIAGGLAQNVLNLAMATGSGFKDPDLRAWESQGYGAVSDVEWAG